MMTRRAEPLVWVCRALTPLWTGDAHGKGDRLITTGLLGSIRWWYEVIVRGLGGSACDPGYHENDRPKPCPASGKRPHEPGHHCVSCELFGCTSWARKFRFDVLGPDGKPQQTQIRKDDRFQLVFTPIRPIGIAEWALLDVTIRLIADYGAMGGKTVYKPSDEVALADAGLPDFDEALVLRQPVRGSPLKKNDRLLSIDGQEMTSRGAVEAALSRRPTGEPVRMEVERDGIKTEIEGWVGKRHHQDYGLVLIERPAAALSVGRDRLQDYVHRDQRWRRVEHGDFAWASLENFWCVANKYLTRVNAKDCSFNRVLGRKEDKSIKERNGRRVVRWSDLLVNSNDKASKWLAGGRGESKKVVSFKDPPRTFGFIRPGVVTLDDVRKRLEEAWRSGNVGDDVLLTGSRVLDALVPPEAMS